MLSRLERAIYMFTVLPPSTVSAAGGFGIHNGACGNALVLHIFAYNLKAAIL